MKGKIAQPKGLGGLIRHWRGVRKISQKNLALTAGISARHLSFIETGRSRPGRHTLLKIGRALRLSLHWQNLLFQASGYSPYFAELAYEDPEMAVVWDAVSQIMNQHEPFPAAVLDSQYDILWSNHGMQRLVAAFAGKGALEKYPNILRLSFAEDGLRPYIKDWGRTESFILHHLLEEAETKQHEGLWSLYYELSDQAVEGGANNTRTEVDHVVMPFTLENETIRLNLFSTITMFNAALSVTVEEMRIESIFPADEITREIFLQYFG